MLLPRTIGRIRPRAPIPLIACTQVISLTLLPSFQPLRFASIKVKRIQKKKPLEKNRVRRLIKGTRLEVKKPKKPSKVRRDPSTYIDLKEVEFNPWDIRGRSTLKVAYIPFV